MTPTPAQFALALLLVLPAAGCERAAAATQVPAGATQATLSLQKVDCESCGMSVVSELERRDGVYSAAFDRDAVEVAVTYDPQRVRPSDLVQVAVDLGFAATLGAGRGAYTPEVAFAPHMDVQQISKQGERADLESSLAPGKVTVFDFHAIWCGPCKDVDRHMLSVLHTNPDVALRKLNVVDWDSEVAKQHLVGVPNLPYVIVFGPSGRRVARISGLHLDELDDAIARARKR